MSRYVKLALIFLSVSVSTTFQVNQAAAACRYRMSAQDQFNGRLRERSRFRCVVSEDDLFSPVVGRTATDGKAQIRRRVRDARRHALQPRAEHHLGNACRWPPVRHARAHGRFRSGHAGQICLPGNGRGDPRRSLRIGAGFQGGPRQPLTAGGLPPYHPRDVHSSAEIRMPRASNRSGRTIGDNVLFRWMSVVSAGRGA